MEKVGIEQCGVEPIDQPPAGTDFVASLEQDVGSASRIMKFLKCILDTREGFLTLLQWMDCQRNGSWWASCISY